MLPVILASGSIYRRELIEKLKLSVLYDSPDIDESPRPGEAIADLVQRLSVAKARALGERYPSHLIIGSDQVAELDGETITKPGSHEIAKRQLLHSSGKQMLFHTGLCLYNSASGSQRYQLATTRVKFRRLGEQQIERYLQLERPYDCAGSFKSEGLGICLLDYIQGDDPNALVGLPLIALTDLLAEEGIQLPLVSGSDSSNRS